MAKTRVFVDTNVILAAFQTGAWTAICTHYAVETVEKCIEEAMTGDPTEPGRIAVDRVTLVGGLAGRHPVGKREIAALVLDHPHCQGLDDGEMHLLAWLYGQRLLPSVLILVSTADKAAIVATCLLGGIDSLVSLERLARDAGVTLGQVGRLPRHYRDTWLDEMKIKIRLGVSP